MAYFRARPHIFFGKRRQSWVASRPGLAETYIGSQATEQCVGQVLIMIGIHSPRRHGDSAVVQACARQQACVHEGDMGSSSKKTYTDNDNTIGCLYSINYSDWKRIEILLNWKIHWRAMPGSSQPCLPFLTPHSRKLVIRGKPTPEDWVENAGSGDQKEAELRFRFFLPPAYSDITSQLPILICFCDFPVLCASSLQKSFLLPQLVWLVWDPSTC